MLGWYHDKNAGYLIGGSLPIAERMSKRYHELEGNVMTKSLPDRLKGLDNFYMVGQWVSTGAGLPPAAQSGKWIIQTIYKENKMKFNLVIELFDEL